jgi:hypothetical protein
MFSVNLKLWHFRTKNKSTITNWFSFHLRFYVYVSKERDKFTSQIFRFVKGKKGCLHYDVLGFLAS